MDYGPYHQYSHVDQELVDKIVCKLKSQGIFDQFRKDCLADVDTKPAYQNLQQRVNGTVANFLANHKWRHDLNKNQLRENLRRHVQQDFLEVGVSRIVEQVVNPKICPVFLPQVEDVVYNCLGLEKPKPKRPPPGLHIPPSRLPIKRSISPLSLLPLDLDPVSPESDHPMDNDSLNGDNRNKDESRNSLLHTDNDDSHLSGISELTSHGSIKDLSEHACMSEKSNILVDQTDNDVPSYSSSHKTFVGCNNTAGPDFDNFSNLQEKLKKTDHLSGNLVKKEHQGQNNDDELEGHNKENESNKLSSSLIPLDDFGACKQESPLEESHGLNSTDNSKNDDFKLEVKHEGLPYNNNGIIQNDASSDIVCKNEKHEESTSNNTKYSEDSRSSDSGKEKKLKSDLPTEMKQNGSKREHRKFSANGEKHKYSKEDKNRHEKSQGGSKQKIDTDSECTSSDKDQKSDYNSSDKELPNRHLENRSASNISLIESKKISSDGVKENKESKSVKANVKNESPNKTDRKLSSSSHRSSSRDKKPELFKDSKSKDNKNEKDKDKSRHRTSNDKTDDKKYKEKSSQEGKKQESRDEKDRQRPRKEKMSDEKDKHIINSDRNKNELTSTKSKEHRSKDDQSKYDRERHKGSKTESKDKKDKPDKKEHNRHKDEGDKRDKEKNKDKDDKQRSSKDNRGRHHEKTRPDNFDTKSDVRKNVETKVSENSSQKHGSEERNFNKRSGSNLDLSKRGSLPPDKQERDERSKDRERSSKKRKGERCKEEVKYKEARRSTDRDSNGRGNSGLVDKGAQQTQNINSKNISSGNSQALEGSANDQNSCSDSVLVTNNDIHQDSESRSSICEGQQGINEIDLILQKINSSIEEVQSTENSTDALDSIEEPHSESTTEPILEYPEASGLSSVTNVKKPKIAKNIFEIRKIMQARKNIDRKRRNDAMKHKMKHMLRDNERNHNDVANAVSVIVKNSLASKSTTKGRSLELAAVNENVDSNNLSEKRECSSKLDNSTLKGDPTEFVNAPCNSVLIRHESNNEAAAPHGEVFRGFNEVEISTALQKLSKIRCCRSQIHVRLSPLKLNEEVFYNGKLLSLDLQQPQLKPETHGTKSQIKKDILLDNNLNNLNTSSMCISNKSTNFSCSRSDISKSFDGSLNDSDHRTQLGYVNADCNEIKNEITCHYITNQTHSSDCGQEDSHKTKNGCYVVVRVSSNPELSEIEKCSSQDESGSNLPDIISPDNNYDSDINYDENYELNESFCSDFGDSKPLSVSLTETMLENLMKESNLLTDLSRNNEVHKGLEYNRLASVSCSPSGNSQISTNIPERPILSVKTETSSQMSGSVIKKSDSKRKGTLNDVLPEAKKSR